MIEKLGLWFIDIAKYVATGVIISSFFGRMQSLLVIYVVAFIFVLLSLCFGLFLIKKGQS